MTGSDMAFWSCGPYGNLKPHFQVREKGHQVPTTIIESSEVRIAKLKLSTFLGIGEQELKDL